MWDEITDPNQNVKSATVEVYERVSDFTPHVTGRMIIHPCGD